MGPSDAEIERAEAKVAAERDLAVRRISAALDGDGCDDCKNCGEAISPARRAAYPAAKNCLDCAQDGENARRWMR
ncbi:TraR/DksA C4-type zinc finger protein [Maricaulis maris]|uniref:DksA/TraR C4-type zinc finger protein n=1 Tax=Maricaulis maris TaxID=74318 RepID=A0A495DKX7_9PROT|nr:TraR/DksA C4-type zinc finger protein [Maricaulis maris]RKR03592.1 DksA/TraR C4-type zinc finger protein [Maricaulis maris]